MPRTRLAACLLSLALAACTAGPKKPPLMMEAWTQPTEHHKRIVAGAGEWEGTLTMFGDHATPEPVPAQETVEALGAFWVQSRFTCEFMGMPYVGTGCVGYDPSTGKYVGTWIDNMTSYFACMEGQKDASGKLILHWTAPDEVTGELIPHRSETVETATSRVMTFYMGEDDGTKSMIIEMKRKR